MSQGIVLTKGGRINLTKSAPALKRVRVGLGWKENTFDTGADFDLDASAFICKTGADGNPKLISNSHFLFYGHHNDPEGAAVHSGDELTGSAQGDDERITIELSKLHAEATEISFVVTIHDAVTRKQNFGQVSDSKITLYNDEDNTVLATYSLEDAFSNETSVQFGSLYKKDGEWLFKAVGAGFQRGLDQFVIAYGGTLA